jgi:hypothetical protein
MKYEQASEPSMDSLNDLKRDENSYSETEQSITEEDISYITASYKINSILIVILDENINRFIQELKDKVKEKKYFLITPVKRLKN